MFVVPFVCLSAWIAEVLGSQKVQEIFISLHHRTLAADLIGRLYFPNLQHRLYGQHSRTSFSFTLSLFTVCSADNTQATRLIGCSCFPHLQYRLYSQHSQALFLYYKFCLEPLDESLHGLIA